MNERDPSKPQHDGNGENRRPRWRQALVVALVAACMIIPGAMTFAAYQAAQVGPFRLYLPMLFREGTPQPTPTGPTATTTRTPTRTTTATRTPTRTATATRTVTTVATTATTASTVATTATTATTASTVATTATTASTVATTATTVTGTATTTATPTDTGTATTTATPTDTATSTPTETATNTPTNTPTTTPSPTIEPACSPISTLPCSAVDVTVPFALNWSSNAGGLADRNGVGTGFTMADPPSNFIAPFVTPTNPDVPGYEPSQLTVNTAGSGTLAITATKGIQFRDPSVVSGTNTLVNGLGVGFTAPTSSFRVSTTIVNPNVGAGTNNFSQQAGVWFGLDEDNYAKLVLVKAGSNAVRVQLAVERYGNSNPPPVPVQIETAPITGALTTTFTLNLEVNPTTNTVRGFYQLNGGAETQVTGALSSVSIPPSFTAGVNHDGNVGTAPLSFGGIFTTIRNASAATPLVFVFDSFSIEALPPPVVNRSGPPQGPRLEAYTRRRLT